MMMMMMILIGEMLAALFIRAQEL